MRRVNVAATYFLDDISVLVTSSYEDTKEAKAILWLRSHQRGSKPVRALDSSVIGNRLACQVSPIEATRVPITEKINSLPRNQWVTDTWEMRLNLT